MARGNVELLTKVRPENYDPGRYRPEGILAEIVAFCCTLPPRSITAIHGWPGSGKTPTARWLGDQLGFQVVHLDEIRGHCEIGFDEDAARANIAKAREAGSVIVEGVCAARVCSADVLIRVGPWPGHRVTRSLRTFMRTYDARDYSGTVRSFEMTDDEGLGQ